MGGQVGFQIIWLHSGEGCECTTLDCSPEWAQIITKSFPVSLYLQGQGCSDNHSGWIICEHWTWSLWIWKDKTPLLELERKSFPMAVAAASFVNPSDIQKDESSTWAAWVMLQQSSQGLASSLMSIDAAFMLTVWMASCVQRESFVCKMGACPHKELFCLAHFPQCARCLLNLLSQLIFSHIWRSVEMDLCARDIPKGNIYSCCHTRAKKSCAPFQAEPFRQPDSAWGFRERCWL